MRPTLTSLRLAKVRRRERKPESNAAALLRFFDAFLPDSMCTNPADLMRGYIIVGLILCNITISLFTMVGLLFLLELEHNAPIAAALNSACLVGYVATLVLLKKTENYVLCANLIIAILAAVIFFAVQITGGYLESPILQLALQIPVMAFLLLGLRPGVFWLGAILALCCASYFSAVYHVANIQLLQSEQVIQTLYILLQFVLVVLVGAALIVYETLNGLLKRELDAEKIKLEHWASHDDLTGIANRFEFFRRLKTGIDEAQERKHKLGVVYIDLDDFKPVNDNHGHHMGDAALKIVADRLKKVLRLSDTTARLGGDEFGLILPAIHVPDDIESIMPKILAAIREPIEIDGVQFSLRGSCGVAIFPNHSTNHDDLCRFADTAMYRAKEQSDAYLVFEEAMTSQES